MIARQWTARATVEGAAAYLRFFADRLVPELGALPGHLGAQVLTRRSGDGVEILVVTYWESMAAVARFAGSTPGRAVVEPEARALLRDFDAEVSHWEVALDARRG